MKSKDIVAHNIIAYDALYRRAALLDQFSKGLNEMGLLQLIKAFPTQMCPLFTFTGKLSVEEVLDAVYTNDESTLSVADKFVMSLFERYIKSLDNSS